MAILTEPKPLTLAEKAKNQSMVAEFMTKFLVENPEFWGSVRIMFQQGKPVYAETNQTKHFEQ